MTTGNTEVVVAPFDWWWAPVGTAFPGVTDDNVPAAWNKLALDQSRDFDESGIQMVRASQDGEFRGYGAGRVRKLWTISEDLSFQFMVADFTLETSALLIEDNQTVGSTGSGGGLVTADPDGAVVVGTNLGNALTAQTFDISPAAADGTKATLKLLMVSETSAVLTVEKMGSGFVAADITTAKVQAALRGGTSLNTATVTTITTLSRSATLPAETKSLVLGRRGANLAKATFSFMVRGLASPYVGDGRCQINIPQGSFEGQREISMTRNDPLKYGCTIRCIEDSALNGYAQIFAVAA